MEKDSNFSLGGIIQFRNIHIEVKLLVNLFNYLGTRRLSGKCYQATLQLLIYSIVRKGHKGNLE